MAIDAKRLLEFEIPARTVTYADRDVMLYALAVGAGAQGAGELDFVYEESLRVIPSFANMLVFDDSWIDAAGIDLRMVVHGSLDMTFHDPLAAQGTVRTDARIVGAVDKGEGRGGIVVQQTELEQDGRKAGTSLSSLFVRGGGGFGGSIGAQMPAIDIPSRPRDVVIHVPTALNQALLFRLLGDRNPLHADPEVARQSGFERPILHGACTFGLACLTVIRSFCDGDPDRLSRFAARFVGPLVPGQTLVFSFWRDTDGVLFRAETGEGAPVLDNGLAAFKPKEAG